MTDTTEHDAAIVKAAEALVRAYGQHGPWEQQHLATLAALIAAKREAMTPRLLTAEQAHDVHTEALRAGCNPFKAVLSACLERAVKVVEALPECSYALGYHARLLSDIRAARNPTTPTKGD